MPKKKSEIVNPIFCFIDYSDKEFGILVTDETCLPYLLGDSDDEDNTCIATKDLKTKLMKVLTEAGFKHSKRYEKNSN